MRLSNLIRRIKSAFCKPEAVCLGHDEELLLREAMFKKGLAQLKRDLEKTQQPLPREKYTP